MSRFRFVAFTLALGICALSPPSAQTSSIVQFVFSADAHYGITRPAFRGRRPVDAHDVNMALVAAINSLPHARFPHDGGIGASEPIGPFDFVVEAGDIANRMEIYQGHQVQSAARSIAQFTADYVDGLRLQTPAGTRTPVFAIPGNHDASNAVGFYKMMTPVLDPSAVIAIYNRMMAPETPMTAATFDYRRDRVHYSRDVGGIHFQFISIWPDSLERAWMERDLSQVSATTPVIVFAHDEVDAEAKHFINPKGRHDVNATDQFENLLSDTFEDGDVAAPSLKEQRAFESFLRVHRNVSAYFHGNSNWNQFYDYLGPDRSVVLHTFRVDSPMKGKVSLADESRLSFQVATLDLTSRRMTVREALWNIKRRPAPIAWGSSTTVALDPR